jgi:hypothetical protein
VTPSASYADIIVTQVLVDFPGTAFVDFCGTTTGGPACPVGSAKIWNLGAAGISLTAGQTLVLTQNDATCTTGAPLNCSGGGFNFDTSDNHYTGAATVTINAFPGFVDGGNVLRGISTGHTNPDPIDTANNEATDWTGTQNGPGNAFSIQFGYADNIHTNPCTDADLNCLPENPWEPGTPGHTFLGGGTAAPVGYPHSTEIHHCAVNPTANCYDAGAILITGLQVVTVPEPLTLLLLGIGLLGMTAYGNKRHLKKNS